MGAQGEKAEREKMDMVPDAIAKRRVAISVDGGKVIVVERWTITKLIMMTAWLTKNLKNASEFFKDGATFEAFDFATKMLEGLDSKVPEFLQLAVGPDQAADVLELPAGDALEVIVEVIQMNLTDKLAKKAQELIGLFKSKFQAPPKST